MDSKYYLHVISQYMSIHTEKNKFCKLIKQHNIMASQPILSQRTIPQNVPAQKEGFN